MIFVTVACRPSHQAYFRALGKFHNNSLNIQIVRPCTHFKVTINFDNLTLFKTVARLGSLAKLPEYTI